MLKAQLLLSNTNVNLKISTHHLIRLSVLSYTGKPNRATLQVLMQSERFLEQFRLMLDLWAVYSDDE